MILLRGEAGIGKTTLAREVLAEASARGLRSLAAPIFDFGAHLELDVARGPLRRALPPSTAARSRRSTASSSTSSSACR
ncbi:MAG: hypothetical protein H6710_04480 [Myxococcales bacterium]|nr:hypothetical protein [Myxococcales bacterium]